jgi:hypothetical protein
LRTRSAKNGQPYGGVPPFDKIKVADFKPALKGRYG